MNILRVATRNIRRNLRRSILSALALTVSVASIVFLFGFLHGLSDNLTTNVHNFVSGQVRIRHADFDTYEHLSSLHLAIDDAEGVRQRVEEQAAVQSAVARIPFGGLYFQGDETFNVQLLAVDFVQEERYLNASTLLLAGRLPQPDTNEVVAAPALLERFGLQLGDRMTILVTTFARGSNAFTVEIVGVVAFPYASLSRTTLLLPLSRAQYYLRAGSAATEILVKVADGHQPQQVQAALVQLLGSDQFSIKHWEEIGASASIVRTARISYTIMGLVLFILSSTVIINTTMMVIYERRQEIGMLGAIGMSAQQIVALFYLEALCIGAIGAIAGMVIGVGISGYFHYFGLDISAQLGGTDFQVSTLIYPRNSFPTVAAVFLYALAVSGVATLLPSTRCARIKPALALRQD